MLQPVDLDALARRLQAAEQRIRELEHGQQSGTPNLIPQPTQPGGLPYSDEVSSSGEAFTGNTESFEDPHVYRPRFYVDYSHGFVIRPYDKRATPFEMKITGRMQFRYVGYARDANMFTDRAGNVTPIFSRSDFEIERGRLTFSGFLFDPDLHYYLNLDGDTDDNHRLVVHDFWIDYKFSQAFTIYAGKGKVPGSREWVYSSSRTRFADRSMAATFFRPDRSIGVWAKGEPIDGLHYWVAVVNGFDTTDFKPAQVDDSFTYASTMWWDPLADYGKGVSDVKGHEELAIRIGQSFVFSPQHGRNSAGAPRNEERFERISDGTRLITTGALAPGVTVDDFHLYSYSVDAAAKYHGLSFNAEAYFRWIENISGDGPIAISDLFTKGFDAEVGYFLVPHHLEINGRISGVDGFFGDAWEYAGGVTWFINGSHKNKLTFDVTALDGSAASSSSVNISPGLDGVLYRAQYQLAF